MTRLRRWRTWHLHRPDPAAGRTVGTFRFDMCRRCGLHRASWLDRGLPWWQSTWGTSSDVGRQLRYVASEAPAECRR